MDKGSVVSSRSRELFVVERHYYNRLAPSTTYSLSLTVENLGAAAERSSPKVLWWPSSLSMLANVRESEGEPRTTMK